MPDDIMKYKEFVKWLSDNDDDRIFLNSSQEHAVVVISQIFRRSSDTVRVYAKNLCQTIGNKPDYINALSDFVERNGHVRILLNGYNDGCAKESDLYRRLAYYKSKGKDIIVKTTTEKPYFSNDKAQNEIHFTIGDSSSYRIETDIEKQTAKCSMNRPETAKNFADFFDKMFGKNITKEVDLLKLFNYAK